MCTHWYTNVSIFVVCISARRIEHKISKGDDDADRNKLWVMRLIIEKWQRGGAAVQVVGCASDDASQVRASDAGQGPHWA